MSQWHRSCVFLAQNSWDSWGTKMFIRGSPTSPNSLAGSIVRSRPKTHLSASASWATLWPNQKSGPRPTMAQLKTRPSRCSRASWAFPRASATPEKPRIRRQVLFTSLYGADPPWERNSEKEALKTTSSWNCTTKMPAFTRLWTLRMASAPSVS